MQQHSFLSHLYKLKLLAETLGNSKQDEFHGVVLHGETLTCFFTTATVAEVESHSTFHETCLATEVSQNGPCYTAQRLLKLVLQRRCTQVSAKSFNV